MTQTHRFFAADLSQLPLANIIETISFEAILSDSKTYVTSVWDAYRINRPDLPALDTLMLETEPIAVILEAIAYRETMLRGRVNDAARAVLLPYATGTDLDAIGTLFATERLQIGTDALGDPIMQSDDEYRRDIELAPEAFSIAGPEGAYEYFAKRADASILDAAAINPQSNRIDIVLLARDGDGTASDAAISAAYNALSAKDVRPLTDDVHVRSADIVTTSIAMTLQVQSGPAPEAVRAAALAAVNKYIADRRRIGLALRVDGLIGAARAAADLERVIVASPAADVDPGRYGAVTVSTVDITVEVLT